MVTLLRRVAVVRPRAVLRTLCAAAPGLSRCLGNPLRFVVGRTALAWRATLMTFARPAGLPAEPDHVAVLLPEGDAFQARLEDQQHGTRVVAHDFTAFDRCSSSDATLSAGGLTMRSTMAASASKACFFSA